tara:strand:- start:97 stop:1173 length:1077 start_codon:yes stop_codon:yes gene_type:complete
MKRILLKMINTHYFFALLLILLTQYYSFIYADLDFDIDPIQWSTQKSTSYIFTDSDSYRFPINIQLFSSEKDPFYYFITFSSNKTNDQFDTILVDDKPSYILEENASIYSHRFAEFNNHKINYQFYETNVSSVPLSDQITSDYSFIRKYIVIKNSIILTDTFYMEVFPYQQVPPGTYTDLAIISLYKGTTEFLSDATLISRKKIPISIDVKGITELSIFDFNRRIVFNKQDLNINSSKSIQYKFESNEDASLWLESEHGSLSQSQNSLIYYPSTSSNTSNHKSIKLPDASQNLQSLLFSIDPSFYNIETSSSANMTFITEYNSTHNITKKIIYDDELNSSLELPTSFTDTIRFIIKVD